jgi:phospholipid/cholesterol/gamma-HCH transport system substrate-binding protein
VKNKELIVGSFTAMALIMLYVGFNFLKGIDFFSSSSKYYAVYENIDELAVSNPVYVNGFKAGRVSDIRILQNKNNKVLVELDIDSDIVLGDSTKAILNSDFLGTKSILLSIGKVEKPLQSGDTVISEVAKGLLDVFAASAEPVADNLQTTMRKLNVVLDNLARNSQHLDTLFMKLNYTPGLINKTLTTTNATVEDLGLTFKDIQKDLNGTLNELGPTLRNLKTISDSLKQLRLNRTLEKTEKALTNISAVLEKLKSGDNSASKLLTDDSLYNNLNKVLVNIDSLATHFNNNPKHFMAPLGKSQKKIEKDKKEAREKAAATSTSTK